jgi:hypothetical protein
MGRNNNLPIYVHTLVTCASNSVVYSPFEQLLIGDDLATEYAPRSYLTLLQLVTKQA